MLTIVDTNVALSISSIEEPDAFSNFKLPVSQNIHTCTKFTLIDYRFVFCKVLLLHVICKQIKLSFQKVINFFLTQLLIIIDRLTLDAMGILGTPLTVPMTAASGLIWTV